MSKLTTSVPMGTQYGSEIFPGLYENAVAGKVVDDAATLASGLTVQKVVKWSVTNNRWELCNGTVALSTTDVVGIVEYIDPGDATKGQVRIAGVYTDQISALTANTAYYCQSNGTLGSTETKIFVGRCTKDGRLVMPGGQTIDTSVFALKGTEITPGLTNYIADGLAVTPGTGLNINTSAGRASISEKLVETVTKGLLLDARMVAIVYLKNDGNVGKKNGEFPPADANHVLRYVIDGSATIANSAVGNGLAVANNLTKSGTVTAVDGWIGQAGQFDGSTGCFSSANTTGFPTGTAEREVVVIFTTGTDITSQQTIFSYGTGGYTGLQLLNGTLQYWNNAGSTVDTSFSLSPNTLYIISMSYDGTTLYIKNRADIIYSVASSSTVNATALYVGRASWASSYYFKGIVHYIDLRNKIRTPAQIAAIANKLCLPCQYDAGNLVTNGDFSGGLTSWSQSQTTTAAVVDGKVRVSDANSVYGAGVYQSLGAFRAGTTLNIEADLYVLALGTATSAKVHFYDGQNSISYSTPSEAVLTGDGAVKVKYSTTITSNTTDLRVQLNVAAGNYNFSGADVRADNIKVTLGSPIDIRSILPADCISLGRVRTDGDSVTDINQDYGMGRIEGATLGNRKVFSGWRSATTSQDIPFSNPFATENIQVGEIWYKKSLADSKHRVIDTIYATSFQGATVKSVASDKIIIATGNASLTAGSPMYETQETSGYIGFWMEVIK